MRNFVSFQEALHRVEETLRNQGDLLADCDEVHLVRDLQGRLRLVLPGDQPNRRSDKRRAKHLKIARALEKAAGAYAVPAEQALLYQESLLEPRVLEGTGRRHLEGPAGVELYLVDRQITGAGWDALQGRRPPSGTSSKETERIALFSIKGGVGRSTTGALTAWEWARRGNKVLVVDLDLESPGIGSSLLTETVQPDFGVVDWLVEDGVGQADVVEEGMVLPSPIAARLDGQLLVAPANGRETGDYLPKLGRAYLDLGTAPEQRWQARLLRMLADLEVRFKPDLTILDSRAGIDDLAAAAVHAAHSGVLLFAVATQQTWWAYRLLFRHWRDYGVAPSIRDRLKMVAGMIPETNRPEYLERFVEAAWDLFQEHLYEPAGPGELDAFNFDLKDKEAPHAPLPVYWHRGLTQFETTEPLDEQIVDTALGAYFRGFETWLQSAGGSP